MDEFDSLLNTQHAIDMDTNHAVKLYRHKVHLIGEPNNESDGFLTPDPGPEAKDRTLVHFNEETEKVLALHKKVEIAENQVGQPYFAIEEIPNLISKSFGEDYDYFRADHTGMHLIVSTGLAHIRKEEEDDIVEDVST